MARDRGLIGLGRSGTRELSLTAFSKRIDLGQRAMSIRLEVQVEFNEGG